MIIFISLIVLAAYLTIQAIMVFTINKDQAPRREFDLNEYPMISVLVAARNEEHCIARCLQSLSELDYPEHKIEFLVGDDASTDGTAEVVRSFAEKDHRFKYFLIEEQWGQAQKKANVLAQLARAARGEFLFITDADIEVPQLWVKSMVSAFDPETGCVNGMTVIRQDSKFNTMQSLDWLYFMGVLYVFSKFNLAATAVGNNMAVRREAYDATGGYENLPFSVTEDFLLFKAILAKGWQSKHLCEPANCNVSEAAADWPTLFRQRKRWLTGGRGLPIYWKLILILFGLFQPLIIALLILSPWLALLIWWMRYLLQSFILLALGHRLKFKAPKLSIPRYELYSFFLSLATPIFFLLPGGRSWKGKAYSAKDFS